MSEEIERREVIYERWVDTTCLGCGREITLFFNGGELDSKECCGFLYTLEHTRVDFVVTKLTEAPAPVPVPSDPP